LEFGPGQALTAVAAEIQPQETVRSGGKSARGTAGQVPQNGIPQ